MRRPTTMQRYMLRVCLLCAVLAVCMQGAASAAARLFLQDWREFRDCFQGDIGEWALTPVNIEAMAKFLAADGRTTAWSRIVPALDTLKVRCSMLCERAHTCAH